jgi:predicted PurR-regulated permease PerM
MTARQTFRNTLIVVGTVAALYAAFEGRAILLILLVALIVASALRPGMLWLERRRFPRPLAIAVLYILLIIAVVLLGFYIVPTVINRFGGYVVDADNFADQLIESQRQILESVQNTFGIELTGISSSAIRTSVTNVYTEIQSRVPAAAGNVAGLLSDTLLMFVISAYWLASRDRAVEFFLSLLPVKNRADTRQMIEEMERALGSYVRGAAVISIVVGLLNFLVLRLFSVPTAGIQAFIVGATTAIPVIGGYIGGAASIAIALVSSPEHAVVTTIAFLVIQQLENQVLTPVILGRAVDVNPIVTIVALFIGFALVGVVGALIAVPVAGALQILLMHLVIRPQQQKVAAPPAPKVAEAK